MPKFRRSPITIACFAAAAFSASALAQSGESDAKYDVVTPPACTNSKGETVRFVETNRGRAGLAAGIANRDKDGKPVVLRSNFGAAPPELQRFVDRHECAHHQTGDVDRPHPPRNSPEHLMNESISDCVAILRLRDEEGFDRAATSKVTAALRNDMAKVGFPEISISSRIRNIDSCYKRPGSSDELIKAILQQRAANTSE